MENKSLLSIQANIFKGDSEESITVKIIVDHESNSHLQSSGQVKDFLETPP